MNERLEYLRGEIQNERISYGEIVELQEMASEIDPNDVLLLEWAGVPEGESPCGEKVTSGGEYLLRASF